MGAYLYLALAIAAEVTGTVSLKLSDGFSRLLPSVLVVVGYGVAFFALSQVLKLGLPIGVAYAIWAAAGVALVALVGVLFLKEPVNLAMLSGLVLVVGGVVLIEVGSNA
ncbi:multidrug efflux SMR transporter [Amycolatopsis ultiminotia]|uniref:Multidrug efflux SMR transporter n=1 Tax=Amycolatopsis ultiminotia TaxID=543629 RepID=A0ABP6VCW7_9PSEU